MNYLQFCQPQGWALSTERQEPRFFVSILTDIDANRHYCACMCFNETVSITPSKPVDEEEDPVDGDNRSLVVKTLPAVAHHNIMYAPKCLVLVSRLDYIETFRVCIVYIHKFLMKTHNLLFSFITELSWHYLHSLYRKSWNTVRNSGW